jgi:tungstate transport system permease protein
MPDSLGICLLLIAASLLALVLGAGLAAWLAMARFAGRRVVLAVLGAGAAVPPGLALVLMAGRPAGLMLAAWVALAAPLALLLVHGPLAAGWARHGRGLQSAGVSRWQALRPLLTGQRRALAVAWLAVLARGLGEAAAALALGLLPAVVPLVVPLGGAVVLGGVAVWVSKKAVLF